MEKKTEKFNFEDLLVYQKSLDYLDFIYAITNKFPSEERFGLTSQFQRAAQSVCLNIGEGSGGTKLEFQQFVRISRRSIRECVVCTTIARRRKYISEHDEVKSRTMCSEISKMLSGLLNAIN
jgi:four helix bundle protein